MTKLCIGVVGVGRWGRNHVRVLKELKHEGLVSFIAIHDLDFERAISVAAEFNVDKVFKDLDEFAKHVDAAIIATPIGTLASIAKTLIEQNIHVLIEKPVAQNACEAEELYLKARNRNVLAVPGFIMRYNPIAIKLREFVGSYKVHYIIFRRLSRRPPHARQYPILLDLAIHDVDLCRYILRGENIYVESSMIIHSTIDDIVIAVLRGTTTRCLIHVDGLSLAKIREIEIVGEDIFIRGNTDDLTINVRRSDGSYFIEKVTGEEEPLKKEVRSFIERLSGKPVEIPTLEDAIEALRILDTIRRRI